MTKDELISKLLEQGFSVSFVVLSPVKSWGNYYACGTHTSGNIMAGYGATPEEALNSILARIPL